MAGREETWGTGNCGETDAAADRQLGRSPVLPSLRRPGRAFRASSVGKCPSRKRPDDAITPAARANQGGRLTSQSWSLWNTRTLDEAARARAPTKLDCWALFG